MASALQPRNEGSTPPQAARLGSHKNAHSPWSAPRERKRRSKAVPAHLASVEEVEFTTSPPKRHHGDSGSPAARELGLDRPLGSPFHTADGPSAGAGGGEAGPLAQGLFALASDAGYSPLASGLNAPSLASRTSFQQPWQAPAAAADKQRRQVRQAAAWRAAAGRQRSSVDGGAGGGPAATAASGCDSSAAPCTAAPCHPPPGSVFSSTQWQPALAAAAAGRQHLPLPSMAPAPASPAQQQQQQPARQHEQCVLPSRPIPAVPPPAPQSKQQQQQQMAVDGSRPTSAQRGAARCSSGGQEMDTDIDQQQLRSSWGSDRSADVAPWQNLQARLREGAAADAAECRRQASLASEGGASDAPMRGSVEGAPSVRSSLDGPTCSERQTSQLPLRAAARGGAPWHSHLASPRQGVDLDGASPDTLLQGRSSSGRKQRSDGRKWGCFTCASPFSCRQRPSTAGTVGSDGEGEVVRRNASPGGGHQEEEEEGEEFVIRRQASYLSLVADGSPGDVARASAGRPKHTSLNRPPSDGDLAGRHHAFSARCTPPGLPWSPCSDADADGASCSDGSFSLPSRGPRQLRSVGLRDASLEELTGELPCVLGGDDMEGAGGEGAGGEGPPPAPTVDALNDMLKSLSLCPTAHPKDAEELVAQACAEGGIQPNATTARTLEKLWAVHEQLFG